MSCEIKQLAKIGDLKHIQEVFGLSQGLFRRFLTVPSY